MDSSVLAMSDQILPTCPRMYISIHHPLDQAHPCLRLTWIFLQKELEAGMVKLCVESEVE